MIEKLVEARNRLDLIEDIVSGYVYMVATDGTRVFVQSAYDADVVEKRLTDWDLVTAALTDPRTTIEDIRNIMGGN